MPDERPHLQPLPLEPFRVYAYGTRTVHLDGHVEVARAYYSVPPGHVGRAVWVQWDVQHVRILTASTGQLLREHTRVQPGRHRTAREDRPAPVFRRPCTAVEEDDASRQSFAGLDLVRRYFRQLELARRIRRHVGGTVPGTDYGVTGMVLLLTLVLMGGRRGAPRSGARSGGSGPGGPTRRRRRP